MHRRRFVALIGALAAPLVRGQGSPKVRRIGFLQILARKDLEDFVRAFEDGLRDHGWVNGRNLESEYRFADGKLERIPELARELEQRGVEVLVTGTNPGALSARDATTRVPIVAAIGTNMVDVGLAVSLARPGGRVTGLAYVLGVELYGKRLEILKEAVPRASRIAVLWDPRFENSAEFKPSTERAASALKQTLVWVVVSESDEADSLVAQALREQADALCVVGGAKTYGMRVRLVELAARHRLPAIYDVPAFADAGGLLTHSPSLTGS